MFFRKDRRHTRMDLCNEFIGFFAREDRRATRDSIAKDEEEHCAVITHREAPYLLAYARIHDICQLVSRCLSSKLKSCDLEAEVFFEPALRAKDELWVRK